MLVPALLEKFSDSKTLVRGAAMKVLRRLMAAGSPAKLLSLVAQGAGHAHARVREEVVNAHILVRPQQHSSCKTNGSHAPAQRPAAGLLPSAPNADGSSRQRLPRARGRHSAKP
jgi:hypothetical protein